MEQMEAAPLTAYYRIKCRSVTGMKFLVSNICNIESNEREAKGIKEGKMYAALALRALREANDCYVKQYQPYHCTNAHPYNIKKEKVRKWYTYQRCHSSNIL
jgi:hypothetical protein